MKSYKAALSLAVLCLLVALGTLKLHAFGVADLGTITNLQRMSQVRIVANDANSNQVPVFNGTTPAGLQLFANQTSITFENIVPDPAASPVGSAFFADIVGQAPSSGLVSITAKGQVDASGAVFNNVVATITVIKDPSIPGPPAFWVITAGTIGPK